jgi:hypothetical protein
VKTKVKLDPIVKIPKVITLIFSFYSCYVMNIKTPAAIPKGEAINQYLSIQNHKLLTLSKFVLLHLYSKFTIGLHLFSLLKEIRL